MTAAIMGSKDIGLWLTKIPKKCGIID